MSLLAPLECGRCGRMFSLRHWRIGATAILCRDCAMPEGQAEGRDIGGNPISGNPTRSAPPAALPKPIKEGVEC